MLEQAEEKAHSLQTRLYRAQKERDELRAKLARAESDLVKTTAELVACEKERDAMRRVVEAALARRRAFHDRHEGVIGEDEFGAARDAFAAALDAYEKEAK